MGGSKQETKVEVQQTNVQNQEALLNSNKSLSDTLGGLVDVLKAQAENPAPYIPINIIPDQQQSPTQYQNNDLNNLMSLMYLETMRAQPVVQNQKEAPDNLKTIFIAAVIVVMAIFLMRRLNI